MTCGPGLQDGWGLYVHVPWCRVRCPYCAFYVLPEHEMQADPYVTSVLAEHHLRRGDFPGAPRTVYLGGGTPSRLPLPALRDLLGGLLGAHVPEELTVEANPEDVTPDWANAVAALGVTRVSLGVQTLKPDHARRLGRARTVPTAPAAARALIDAGLRSWSADLIFGLPHQTLDELRADLDALLALDPPHVSLYGLTIEEGTAYARAAERGVFTPADEDLWRAMYDHLVAALRSAGIDRYEVSNFARAGHRSRHNEAYWKDRPYLGLGPSAHSYLPDGDRVTGHPDLARWQADLHGDRERPDAEAAASDLLVSGLRGVDGLSLARLADRTALRPDPAAVTRLVRLGLLRDAPPHAVLALSDEGFAVADGVVRALVDALGPV